MGYAQYHIDLLRKWADVLAIPSGQFVNEDLRNAADAFAALASPAPAAAEGDGEALRYLTSLLVSFVNQHCDPVPEWKPLPDLMGVISQFDNATTVVREIKARAEKAEKERDEARAEAQRLDVINQALRSA